MEKQRLIPIYGVKDLPRELDHWVVNLKANCCTPMKNAAKLISQFPQVYEGVDGEITVRIFRDLDNNCHPVAVFHHDGEVLVLGRKETVRKAVFFSLTLCN
jgi:hypothetical protein